MASTSSSLPAVRAPVSNGALGMALFVAAEAMFFTGLVSALLVLRAQAVGWPPIGQPRLPVAVTGINTGVLLLSGWTMLRALAAWREGWAGAGRWLGGTVLLGALFLAVQGGEWVRLVAFGLTTRSSLYGATFYTLVGAHGLHVLAALIALLWVSRRGRARGEGALLPVSMYWIFVVLVWPVLYVLVYLA